MKNLSGVLKRNPAYFSGYFLFVLILSVYCISINKPEGFMLINRFHFKMLDYFFILFTNLGNGLFLIVVMAFLFIRKKTGWSLQIGISFLASGLIVQVLKHLIHSPRPKLFFGPVAIHCINGITGTGSASFPSGHTATIFALTTLLSIYFQDRKSGILFILIAALTGFSRIYLSQHFPVDVLAGSFAGVLVSVAVYLLVPLKFFEKRLPDYKWERQSINLRQ
ncbi:MAG TPA: phosphatase PAP2 family protein [Puia sp.]|nr:phosphatase PAP2 family protein [Puia sp.]